MVSYNEIVVFGLYQPMTKMATYGSISGVTRISSWGRGRGGQQAFKFSDKSMFGVVECL